VPQLAFANSFWESFDALEKPVKAGVRKAMKRFQQLSIAELYADKGLHLESVVNARDPRMRTIHVTDFWRGLAGVGRRSQGWARHGASMMPTESSLPEAPRTRMALVSPE